MPTPFRIGLCGWGTVAQAFYRLLQHNATLIEQRSGVRLQIQAVSSRTPPDLQGIASLPDVLDVAALDSLDAVIELIGGTDTAYQLALRTLNSGKHFITANKALMATHGEELTALAMQKNVSIGCEASVGGGIPLLRTICRAFTSDRTSAIHGILNGTCNYILTQMEQGRDFSDALKTAQELGFAEADPSLDIDGSDAAQKLAILSHLTFATPLAFDHISQEGIEQLLPFDLHTAERLGYSIRHLAIAEKHASTHQVAARVHLAMLPQSSPLAQVQNEVSAVLFRNEAMGDQFLSGAGAGGAATAASVLADAIELAQHPGTSKYLATGPGSAHFDTSANYSCRRYLRLKIRHTPGALARLTSLTGKLGINIEKIEQHQQEPDAIEGSEFRNVVMILSSVNEKLMKQLLKELSSTNEVGDEMLHLRMVEFQS
ncbi:MAG: homoserine dehydrogenase [Gammaproteobacteria bacterium]